MIKFYKMEAQGNDFMIIDGRTQTVPELDKSVIRSWCDRRLGIGCDQLLLLETSLDADATMRVFNNDGSEAANCGNGARCVGDLLMRNTARDSVQIAIADRIINAHRDGSAVVVDMGAATITTSNVHYADVTIGNQHRVYFDATEALDPTLNVEIVTGNGGDHLWIDIIERGAGRTPACGSGACAVAAAWWQLQQAVMPLTIVMPGGEVQVFGRSESIQLSGVVHTCFQGQLSIVA
ncbi:MAG: diaminopimelate epimerase [Mariprofundales bacterium]